MIEDQKKKKYGQMGKVRGEKGGKSSYKQRMQRVNEDFWNKEMEYVDIDDY